MMQYLWTVIVAVYTKIAELMEAWADDEKSPPEWADPLLWKESLLR